MTTLTIRLPEDTSLRLKQLAASRGQCPTPVEMCYEGGWAVLALFTS
jgi:hypothetical protein